MRAVLILLIGLLGLLGGSAQAASGTLSVTNARHDVVQVLIDGVSQGQIPPGAAQAYALRPGNHDVLVTCSRGLAVAQERIQISPYAVQTLTLPPAPGEVTVSNGSGAKMGLKVDGQPAGELLPGQQQVLRLTPGNHQFQAVYVQHGQERTLQKATLRVAPASRAQLALAPARSGLVKVINRVAQGAQLRVDGALVGAMALGEERLVETRLGSVPVELLSGAQVLSSDVVQVRPYEDTVLCAEIKVGRVALTNPLPIPVRLALGGSARVVNPGQQATFDKLPVGSHVVNVARLEGEPIAALTVAVQANQTTRVAVPAPSTGIVAVTNPSPHPAQVYVDGRQVATLDPWEEARLALPLGTRKVRIVGHGGRVLASQPVRVDPYAQVSLYAGVGSPAPPSYPQPAPAPPQPSTCPSSSMARAH